MLSTETSVKIDFDPVDDSEYVLGLAGGGDELWAELILATDSIDEPVPARELVFDAMVE